MLAQSLIAVARLGLTACGDEEDVLALYEPFDVDPDDPAAIGGINYYYDISA